MSYQRQNLHSLLDLVHRIFIGKDRENRGQIYAPNIAPKLHILKNKLNWNILH